MLAIIEVLLESILGFILEFICEGIVYGIQYLITGVISKSVKSARDGIKSIADDAAKTTENRAWIIFSLIMSGIIAGVFISLTFPERLFKIGSITGISLLITPLIMGLITSMVGRWEKEHNRGPSFMATFLGGVIFGLAAAVTRLLFLFSQHQV